MGHTHGAGGRYDQMVSANREREELAAKLRAGVDASELANLSRANLSGTNLSQANLSQANLHEADLVVANLSGANLSGANLSGAKLHQADLVGANLRGANLRGANLRGAYLHQADLVRANLNGAYLNGAYLHQADLVGAYLHQADLSGAYLHQADLSGAYLHQADLTRANLTRANLRGSDLVGAYLGRANLGEANLSEANLHQANLSEANLSEANLRGVTATDVELPGGIAKADVSWATVDWRTVARSLRWDGLQHFLVRTGMPEVAAIYLIESLRTIDEMDLFTMLQSVFLSYGGPDENFADRLRDALTANGVRTWFFPKDAIPGARLHRHIQNEINAYDRMILCCSEASLQRKGVLHEIEEVLEREQREGGAEIVIPVLLDPIFDSGDEPPSWWPAGKLHVYRSLNSRVAADFRGTTDDPDKWAEQLGRVLVALRKRPAPGT